MVGDKNWRFLETPGTTIRLPSYIISYKKEDKRRLSATPSRSKPPRREARADSDGRQDLVGNPGTTRDPRQHHPVPVPKLQEWRQEEIMMGDKTWRFPKTPAPPSGSQATQATRRETRGDCDGRQELAMSRDPRHHHPAPKLRKLQAGRQEEIMMGDETWRFPRTPGTTMSSLEPLQ